MDKTIEVNIRGMDCADCTMHVKEAIRALPGVSGVDVFLTSEKAVVRLDPELVPLAHIQRAVEDAGYSVAASEGLAQTERTGAAFTRQVLGLFGLVFAAVLLVVVAGEWLGLFKSLTNRIPLPVGAALVLLAGFPVFRNVVRAALKRQVIAHTLMSVGVVAALVIGEWAAAVLIVFFMRVGDYAERFTTGRARTAVKNLTAMAPQNAHLERDGQDVEVPVSELRPGDIVIVRPGEKIPVDGQVISGQATLDQSAITGEAMPVEAGQGKRVFAASLLQAGSLRVQTLQVGPDTTFGKVIRMVEEAEAHRADVQQVADKFSAYYLPVVAGVALLTFLIRRDPLATAAVLVVACSCSFALATPIAMLASIGAAARGGLLIKGGKYLENLARADVLLIDKTGTLTLGRPEIVDVITEGGQEGGQLGSGLQANEAGRSLLRLAASAERYSEHPLAEAVRRLAVSWGVPTGEPEMFENFPGTGVRARVEGCQVAVGNQRLLEGRLDGSDLLERAAGLEAEGKSLLYVTVDGRLAGVLAAADTLRPEAPAALADAASLGIEKIELLTGDHPASAAMLVAALSRASGGLEIAYRASLLPEDKINVVRDYQAQGKTVVMIGDGINDAPALAQADVGIAMGAAGSDIALEAAHIALMRDDWSLVPQSMEIARRTMRVVKVNIAFTAFYNLIGLSLAALGFLPPILAAAAQSLPDLGILANSSRLLRQRRLQRQER